VSGEDERPDRIGYKSPPEHTRFKKGRSGNPSGRPKRAAGHKQTVARILQEPVTTRTKDGRKKRLTTQEAILLRLKQKALDGDVRAIDRLNTFARELEAIEEAKAYNARRNELEAEDKEMIRWGLTLLSKVIVTRSGVGPAE
jgi:hypothetical protein